jgi:hypothetical protein
VLDPWPALADGIEIIWAPALFGQCRRPRLRLVEDEFEKEN